MEGNDLIQEEAAELIAPEVIRPEVNFLLLPFFALSWKEVKKLTKIEYQARLKRGGKEIKLSWIVSANVDYGIPTPFDKEVKGVVDAIIERVKKPILNPLELPYIAEMARMIDLKPNKNGKYPGWVYQKIKESFRRMTLTGVESKGTFYIKGKRMWVDKTFHLYDSVIFRGERLSDGAVAETNYLWLNDLFLDSINNNYVKPIDYTYFQSLKNCIAKRLYEFLGIKFYGLRNKREQFFRIGYFNLCQLLPITPQQSFSLINKNLKPAHDELIQTGFLAKVEYERTKDRKSFNVLYFPGERARKEMQGDWGEIPELEDVQPLEIEAPKERTIAEGVVHDKMTACGRRRGAHRTLPTPFSHAREESFLNQQPHPQPYDSELRSNELRSTELQDYEKEMSPIAQELFNRGITKSVAIDFAESFPVEHIKEKIEMHDAFKATGTLTQNAAGWLREAITRNFELSSEQKKKQERFLKQQASQEVRAKIEEQAREIQEQRLKKATADFPDSEQWVRERVVECVKMREMTIKAIGGDQFSEEEITEMYLKFQAEVPKTDEEKRGWLINNYNEYALSSIIEELKEEQQQNQSAGMFAALTDDFGLRAVDNFPQELTKTETANEQVNNSIEDVLTEVARQRAEFEGNNKK